MRHVALPFNGKECPMWNEILDRLLGKTGSSRQFALVDTPRVGVSGANVVILSRDDKLFAFKWRPSNDAHSIAQQMRGRQQLAELYGEHHLPQVIANSSEAMLMAYAGESLSWMVDNHALSVSLLDKRVRALYGKVAAVWESHNKACKPSDVHQMARDPRERWMRIRRNVLGATVEGIELRKYQDMPLVVNGHEFPSLSAIFRQVPKLYAPPRRAVLCHGDITGENVLLERQRENAWQLIDFEWFGWHDWRVAVTFMGEWWLANHVAVNRATIGVEGRRLVVNYTVEVPSATKLVVERAHELAEQMGKISREADWRDQLRLQAAILFIGDIRFVTSRRRSDDHAIALLGQGIETLAPFLTK